ncbi:hypothetical protein SAMN04488072_106118 [Lentibacillus halodurans]|uniref:Uncharacterized protein n=1 Tax=Lentibacillus halodurans TaxID=237679 RepID=A0A1I0XZL9_9BACI|nr:hypothetical protein [Lentibacillus halodurans]SFB05836.1 hypothetical protein SAMN04488072_106118 [Lentibacillus halodurans]
MKRYWRLIAVILLVVLTIGTFYIQSAIAANGLQDITVEKVSGNEDEMEPVTISGSYMLGNAMDESVQVDVEGTTYGSEQSFFKRFRNGFFHERILQLQQAHRNFMRGKGGSISSYMETADTLAYANVINQTMPGRGEIKFDIAVLDKKNDETTSFTVPVPNRAMYAQVQVQDVQMTDDELHVMTRNYPRDGGEEAHLYRFDIPDQDITGDDTMISGDIQESERTYFNMVTDSDETASHDDVIFKKTTRTSGLDDDQNSGAEQPAQDVTNNYIIYDPETEETRSLELPESLVDQDILDRDNTTLYFGSQQQIVQYDLETEQITSEIEVPTSYEETEKLGSITRIKNDKAYMLTRNQQAPRRLLVLDLTSGNTLFEGKIKLDEPVGQDASLHFYELSVE